MRRRDEGGGATRRQVVDAQTVVIDGSRHEPQPGSREQLPLPLERRVLDDDVAPHGGPGEPPEHGQTLCEAGDHEHLRAGGADAAGAGEVRRQCVAQLDPAHRIAVARVRRRGRAAGPAAPPPATPRAGTRRRPDHRRRSRRAAGRRPARRRARRPARRRSSAAPARDGSAAGRGRRATAHRDGCARAPPPPAAPPRRRPCLGPRRARWRARGWTAARPRPAADRRRSPRAAPARWRGAGRDRGEVEEEVHWSTDLAMNWSKTLFQFDTTVAA